MGGRGGGGVQHAREAMGEVCVLPVVTNLRAAGLAYGASLGAGRPTLCRSESICLCAMDA